MGSFISGKVGQEFRWGINDCNTFFIELHDKLYGTDDLKRVKQQYINKKTAIKFLKNLGLTPAQWLHIRNYSQIKGKKDWQDGDVLTIQHKIYASVYVYFDGAFWTVPEEQTMRGYHPDSFTNVTYTGWRKNG